MIAHAPGETPAISPLPVHLQAELEAELQQELAAYGVDAASGCMTPHQYEVATAALARRREEALRLRPPGDQARARHLHATMLWHLHQVLPCRP